MAFYGRHRVQVLVWPWDYQPFVCTDDVVSCIVSKSVASGQSLRLSLFARPVPRGLTAGGTVERDYGSGYLDVIGPNDWLFVWVDPGDDSDPEPLFLGFVDRISYAREIAEDGSKNVAIDISASGWEKAVKNTMALTNPYLSSNISIPNLLALGPSGQQPTQGARETEPGIGLWQDKTPAIIQWLVRTFLRTDRSDADTVDIEGLRADIDAVISTEGETVADELGVDPAARDRTPDEYGYREIQTIMGQFHLPNTGLSLWNFIVMKFQDIQQRAYLDTNMFLNQTNTSLGALIDNFSNQLLNELIYDVRRVSDSGTSDIDSTLAPNVEGGYSRSAIDEFVDGASSVSSDLEGLVGDVAPHMIFRLRPLFADELNELDGPTMDEADFTSLDLGPSDEDIHNLTILDSPSVHSNSPARITSGFPGYAEHRPQSLYSIARHGVRLLSDSTMAWPAEYTVPIPNPSILADWEIRLHRAGLENARNWSGSVDLPRYVRGLFIGGKLVIRHVAHPGVTTRGETKIYYVDSVDYNYSADGRFATSLGLTRGQRLS